MAYIPTDWTNREVERPRTYIMTENVDGTVTMTPSEGTIFVAGTPLDATNLNKMETQIASNDANKADKTDLTANYYTKTATQNYVKDYAHFQTTLWTGTAYMQEGQIITPTKKLTQCRNGWVLYWSDYDDGTGANDFQFYLSVINRGWASHFAGKNMNFIIPCYSSAGEYRHIIKECDVHDTQLVGYASNNIGSGHLSRDVVLRRVVEF